MRQPSDMRQVLPLLIVATVAALILRAWLQTALAQHGLHRSIATDISFLVVPLVLIGITFPLWQRDPWFIARRYQLADLTPRTLVVAILVGILLRLAALAPGFEVSPELAWFRLTVNFSCVSIGFLLFSLFTSALVTPLVEEALFRGYLLTILKSLGSLVAVVVTALLFAVVHRTTTWLIAFGVGIVFALQTLQTGNLWSATISHATFNLLAQFDRHCARGNAFIDVDVPQFPNSHALPYFVAAVAAIAVSLLLLWKPPGPPKRPG